MLSDRQRVCAADQVGCLRGIGRENLASLLTAPSSSSADSHGSRPAPLAHTIGALPHHPPRGTSRQTCQVPARAACAPPQAPSGQLDPERKPTCCHQSRPTAPRGREQRPAGRVFRGAGGRCRLYAVAAAAGMQPPAPCQRRCPPATQPARCPAAGTPAGCAAAAARGSRCPVRATRTAAGQCLARWRSLQASVWWPAKLSVSSVDVGMLLCGAWQSMSRYKNQPQLQRQEQHGGGAAAPAARLPKYTGGPSPSSCSRTPDCAPSAPISSWAVTGGCWLPWKCRVTPPAACL